MANDNDKVLAKAISLRLSRMTILRLVGSFRIVRIISVILSVKGQYIYRETNCVAHRLAHITGYFRLDDLRLEHTIVIIYDIFYEDICICVQGLGVISLGFTFKILLIIIMTSQLDWMSFP